MTESTAELVLDAQADLGEGPIWHEGLLYWVDIEVGDVCIFDPRSGGNRRINVGQAVGTVVPRQGGGLLLALVEGFAFLDPETEELELLPPVAPASESPHTRMNDGKCDPAGRFWAGSLDRRTDPQPVGALYCMDTDLTVRRVLDGVVCSNGIVWSSDRRSMYYIDTLTRRIDAFDYDLDTGVVTNRRCAAAVPEELGFPDGMSIDAEGKLWVAHWGGSAVRCWDPVAGKLLGSWDLPVSQVSACAFGGPKLDELYVTSARCGLSAEQLEAEPHAGGLFLLRPGVAGVAADTFGGRA